MQKNETVIERDEIVADIDRPILISWGAIFAGLVFLFAMSWLLYLLGIAIGVSVADASDSMSLNNGLGTGAIIWMVVSSLLVYFLGSMLTARLTGKHDATTGMLHGVTLWGLGTTLMLVLSYYGVLGLLQTGQSLLSTAATAIVNTTSSAAAGSASAASYVANNASDWADSPLSNNIQARLKRRATTLIASAESTNGADVSRADAKQAVESFDAATLQQATKQLMMGKSDEAKATLAQKTNLTKQQIDSLVKGISQEFQERLGTADNDTGLAGDVQNRIKQQAASYIASLDAAGGPNVSRRDVRRAIDQMDVATLQRVANRLMNRDTQGAKDVLVAHTDLSEAEVNDVVEGVNNDVKQSINDFQENVNSTVEATSSYAQAVLWTVFAASAMGLAVSVLGGALGADTSKRLHVIQRRSIA